MCFKEDGKSPGPARRDFLAGTLGLAIGGMSPAFAQPATPGATPPPTCTTDGAR